MNPFLANLLPYPFERLNALKDGLKSTSTHDHVSLALGEPKHQPPDFVVEALTDRETITQGLQAYPATRGSDELRGAISHWLKNRYGINADPATEILPVNGTREALFSFGQCMLTGTPNSYTIFPNPFYQIYEGAAILRGSTPFYVPDTDVPAFDKVPEPVWANTDLVYICTPGNPSGSVMTKPQLQDLIEKAQQYDFVLASDECYSEIYPNEHQPPIGLLQAAADLGLDSFNRCITFNSLSKRSNCPGLRSGFVAGDALLIARYYHYRTYHGCAMPNHVQHASSLAWNDENHVIKNRAVYRRKFDSIQPMLARTFGTARPEGAFYYWPDIDMDDEWFARELFRTENITVLPGRYLSREVAGTSPGANRIRIALVAPFDVCDDAIRRLCMFARSQQK